MSDTKIEWCDETSNFVTGCTHGCHYCYARKMAHRIGGMKKNTGYRRLKNAGLDPFSPAIHLDVFRELKDHLKIVKSSRRVFIASMGDVGCDTTFHSTNVLRENHSMEKVTTNVSANFYPPGKAVDFVKRLCLQFDGDHYGNRRHTFLVLSKNPRMFGDIEWPDNAHLGTSIDSGDENARSRLTWMHRVKASVRWISIEPLLDPTFDPKKLEYLGFRPDWVVVGGLSGKKPLPFGCGIAAKRIIIWGRDNGIPVFCKDNLPPLNIGMPKEYPREIK